MINKPYILIVDDEIGSRESLRMILKTNYQVHAVEDGQKALDFISRQRVDVVTLDLNMPGMSGIEVLKEIKRTQDDIQVIIITGFGTMNTAIEAFRYGIVDFLFKPFNIAEIISIVRRAIERRNLTTEIRNFLKKINLQDLLTRNVQRELFSTPRANGSLALDDQDLHRELRTALGQLGNLTHQKAAGQLLDFFKVLIYILESKEPYTSGHSERVLFYADLIAQGLQLSAQEKEDLQIATLLHDIGKVGLSNRLLETARLREKEALAIRRHPLKGARILEPLGFSYAIYSGIRHHHERWDGKGYPDGLAGAEIPVLARIISLADSYDAMTSDRPYRKRIPFQKACDEIEKNSGIQFDPQVVGVFLNFKSQQRLVPISFDSGSR